ncbi:hypothetical protein DFH09DRAFT_1089226 [Mycena vulgaris]|nr:hypothetical protein DFH09DRAFT_1089226 [Mycena vulgaris]
MTDYILDAIQSEVAPARDIRLMDTIITTEILKRYTRSKSQDTMSQKSDLAYGLIQATIWLYKALPIASKRKRAYGLQYMGGEIHARQRVMEEVYLAHNIRQRIPARAANKSDTTSNDGPRAGELDKTMNGFRGCGFGDVAADGRRRAENVRRADVGDGCGEGEATVVVVREREGESQSHGAAEYIRHSSMTSLLHNWPQPVLSVRRACSLYNQCLRYVDSTPTPPTSPTPSRRERPLSVEPGKPRKADKSCLILSLLALTPIFDPEKPCWIVQRSI